MLAHSDVSSSRTVSDDVQQLMLAVPVPAAASAVAAASSSVLSSHDAREQLDEQLVKLLALLLLLRLPQLLPMCVEGINSANELVLLASAGGNSWPLGSLVVGSCASHGLAERELVVDAPAPFSGLLACASQRLLSGCESVLDFSLTGLADRMDLGVDAPLSHGLEVTSLATLTAAETAAGDICKLLHCASSSVSLQLMLLLLQLPPDSHWLLLLAAWEDF